MSGSLPSNPLHAQNYADGACWVDTEIEGNDQLACDTFRLRFSAPAMATRIVPGQFVMVRLAGFNDPLIGRALALYDVVRNGAGVPTKIDVVYLVKGKLTSRLVTMLPGQRVQVWGPLGNGFSTHDCEHLLMVAGGVGITPFLALAKEALGRTSYGDSGRRSAYAQRASLIYGVRSAGYVISEQEFLQAGARVEICTDDGSRRPKARVPDRLAVMFEQNDFSKERLRIATCGPEIMMERVAAIAATQQIPCEVSLETPMACGIGICFSCVAKIRQADGGWDYKRTCVEGPVFAGTDVLW